MPFFHSHFEDKFSAIRRRDKFSILFAFERKLQKIIRPETNPLTTPTLLPRCYTELDRFDRLPLQLTGLFLGSEARNLNSERQSMHRLSNKCYHGARFPRLPL